MNLKKLIGLPISPLQEFIDFYSIDSINPLIRFSKLEYQVITLEKNTGYEECLDLLYKNDLRAATYFEFLAWRDWDRESQIIACGSLQRVHNDMHAFQVYKCDVCIVDGKGHRCEIQNHLKHLDIKLDWYKGAKLLGVREVI